MWRPRTASGSPGPSAFLTGSPEASDQWPRGDFIPVRSRDTCPKRNGTDHRLSRSTRFPGQRTVRRRDCAARPLHRRRRRERAVGPDAVRHHSRLRPPNQYSAGHARHPPPRNGGPRQPTASSHLRRTQRLQPGGYARAVRVRSRTVREHGREGRRATPLLGIACELPGDGRAHALQAASQTGGLGGSVQPHLGEAHPATLIRGRHHGAGCVAGSGAERLAPSHPVPTEQQAALRRIGDLQRRKMAGAHILGPTVDQSGPAMADNRVHRADMRLDHAADG